MHLMHHAAISVAISVVSTSHGVAVQKWDTPAYVIRNCSDRAGPLLRSSSRLGYLSPVGVRVHGRVEGDARFQKMSRSTVVGHILTFTISIHGTAVMLMRTVCRLPGRRSRIVSVERLER